MMFAKSSLILWDIYNLEKIIGNLRNINDDKKIKYFEKYKNEINKTFYGFNNYNKVINYIYKKLHKIILHSRILFDFYFELDSEAKKVYELDEKQKSKIFCHDHYSSPRRKLNE